MKAEHRKELETNILADKVGRVITGAKQGPTRGFLYIIVFVVLIGAIFFGRRWLVWNSQKNSEKWALLEDGSGQGIAQLAQDPKANPGKAAQFQVAWDAFWFRGMKQLGSSPRQARAALDEADDIYRQLADKCKGDPVFEPEALYGMAVIEESRLIDPKNRESLQPVIEKYNAVVKANKESAFAQLAKARVAELEDEDKSRHIIQFYSDLQIELNRNRFPDFEGLEKFLKQHKAAP